MSLKGSLQTVALPEVLQFLADTAKSGELQVRGSGAGGRLWFEDGAISGFDVAASEASFEAIFELLRIDDGDFDFAAGEVRPEDASESDADGRDVSSSLERAEARLAEWREILTVVPSMEHHVELAADAPSDTLSVSRDQWGLVVAIGEGRSIGEVLDGRALREFDGCRAVRDLVAAGLAVVSEPRERGHLASLVALPLPEPEVSEPEEMVEASALEGHFDPAVDDVDAVEAAESHEEVMDSDPHEVHDDDEGHDEPAENHDGYPAAVHDDSGEGDRYAALKSLIVEVDQELSGADPYDAGEYGVEPHDDRPGPEHDMAMPAFGQAMPDLAETDVMPAFGEPMHASVPALSVVDQPVSADDSSVEGRAALQALLAEVSAQPLVVDDGEPVDGLADRGPWQAHELTAFDDLGAWDDEPAEAAEAAAEPALSEAPAFADAEAGVEAGADADDETSLESATPAEEPINRGLLLKFLSSVRN